jgi:hypothetical protein
MAHKLTTVAALAVLVAAAGMPLAVAEANLQDGQPTRERIIQRAMDSMDERQRERESREIRVYDFAKVINTDKEGEVENIAVSAEMLLGVRTAFLSDGRYAISATPDDHTRLEAFLSQIRSSVDADRNDANAHDDHSYTVRILAAVAAEHSAPSVGDRFPTSNIEVLFAPMITVNGGDRASVSAMESETYIAEYQPVVSNNAVAYDPGTDEMETGVEMEITVDGAGDDGAVEISLEGRIARGEVRQQTLKLGDSSLPIGLPFVRDRNIEADITLPTSDTPTVVASLPGFEPGTRLVIAVQVADFARRRGQ